MSFESLDSALDDPAQEPHPAPPPLDERRTVSSSRLIAGLLLIPSVPLLLLSAGALALFYVAPTRFNALLERLPGDQILRSALAFAPAALLALVVLAALYFVESPARSKAPAALEPEVVADDGAAPVMGRGWWRSRATLSALLLLLAMSTIFALLAFALPTRFWGLLEDLPGQRYLRIAVPTAPIGFAGLSLLAALLVRRGPKAPQGSWIDRAPRLLPASALGLALMMLAGSVGSLVMFSLQPTRLDSLLERIPVQALIRLQLAFAPLLLLAVVTLAALSLWRGRTASESAHPGDSRSRQLDIGWLASSGLLMALFTGAGLLVGAAFLLLR